MNKRLWLNLALLALAALLAWWIAFKPEPAAPAAQRLFNVAPHEVRHIRISHPHHPTIVIDKQDQHWLLKQPGIAPLNPERIKHLLTILNEPIVSSYPMAAGELAKFGLDANAIQLDINDEQASFGNTNPVTRNRYVLKDGQLHTIAEIIYGTLGSSVTNLLTHELFPQHSPLLEVQAPQGLRSLETAQWQSLQASNIADYTGNETTLGIITAQLEDGTQLQFSILSLSPSIILGRDDLQTRYTLDEQASALLR